MKLPFFCGMVAGCLSTSLIAFSQMIKKNQRNIEDHNKIVLDEEEPRVQQILAHGWPQGGHFTRRLSNHVLEYDCVKKIPVWVAEHLTQATMKGDANRKNSRFKMDHVIPEEFSAQNSDYQRSGWSRGHMAPAGDNKHSQNAMDETFFLTNVLPQDINNNSGFWNRLEIYCRDLTERYKDVWITSGPLFIPVIQEDGKKIISFQVIGENEVAVPTHLYKTVVADDGKQVVSAAFIVPNKPIDYSHHLKEFQVSMESLEKRLGYKLFLQLDRNLLGNLCEADGCNLMSKYDMDRYIFTRKLRAANNIQKLEKVWQEIHTKGIIVDDSLKETYETQVTHIALEEACLATQGITLSKETQDTRQSSCG